MSRTTKANLEWAISLLNSLSNKEYRLTGAYGGYQLVLMEEKGGQRPISSGGYVSKSQLYDQIQAIHNYHYSVTKE